MRFNIPETFRRVWKLSFVLSILLQEDFALTEASHAIVGIIQAFPNLRLPEGLEVIPPGEEKQALTIVVSSADGCKVVLR
jgi:hypothetical protein